MKPPTTQPSGGSFPAAVRLMKNYINYRNNLVLDLARVFTGFSADAGQAPTFLSLRFSF
jgi:hypothetical protein